MLIQTRRCTIRPLVAADIDEVAAYRDDLDWMRFQGIKGLDRAGYVERLVGAGFRAETGGQLAVVLTETGRVVGDLYVKLTPPIGWIGYTIGRADAGQALGAEAVRGLIGWLGARGDLTCVQAEVEPANVASIRLLAAAGFTVRATGPETLVYGLDLVRPVA